MMRTLWQTTGMVLTLGLAMSACGKDDAKDTSDAATTGSGSGSGSDGTTDPTPDVIVHDSQFVLTVQNDPVSTARVSTAAYTVEMTADTLSGFIRYSEQDDAGVETCAAVLTIRPQAADIDPHGDTGAPAPEPEIPCDSCTVWHYAHTDLSVTSGDCTFGSVTTALDQASALVNVPNTLLLYDESGTSTLKVDELDPSGAAMDSVDLTAAGTATYDGSSLSGQNTESATTYTHWRRCESFSTGVTGVLTPGDLALTDNLACPAGVDPGTPVVSIWERDLIFSQQLTAGIMTTVDAVDFFLRTPDGCIAAVEPSPTSCIDATTSLCQSLEHTVATGGNHALLVVHRGCTTEGLDYSFDARVYQL
jgi:hypothetical protein